MEKPWFLIPKSIKHLTALEVFKNLIFPRSYWTCYQFSIKTDMLFLTEYIGPYQDEEEMDRRSPNLRRNDGSYPILGVTEGSCSDDPNSDIQDIPIINQGNASLTPWSYPIAGV